MGKDEIYGANNKLNGDKFLNNVVAVTSIAMLDLIVIGSQCKTPCFALYFTDAQNLTVESFQLCGG